MCVLDYWGMGQSALKERALWLPFPENLPHPFLGLHTFLCSITISIHPQRGRTKAESCPCPDFSQDWEVFPVPTSIKKRRETAVPSPLMGDSPPVASWAVLFWQPVPDMHKIFFPNLRGLCRTRKSGNIWRSYKTKQPGWSGSLKRKSKHCVFSHKKEHERPFRVKWTDCTCPGSLPA